MIVGPETMISILGLTLVATAGLLWLLPVGQCSECPHCKLERLSREHERELRDDRLVSAPRCRVCNHRHQPGERHIR